MISLFTMSPEIQITDCLPLTKVGSSGEEWQWFCWGGNILYRSLTVWSFLIWLNAWVATHIFQCNTMKSLLTLLISCTLDSFCWIFVSVRIAYVVGIGPSNKGRYKSNWSVACSEIAGLPYLIQERYTNFNSKWTIDGKKKREAKC